MELILPVPVQTKTLKDVAGGSLAGAKGTYGIAIKNLKTGESYYSNEHRIFEAGSLYKLWVMAETYKQIAKGTLTGDQELHGDIAVLNEKFHIASEEAELTEGVVDFTVKSALTQMITISHNYAALVLSDRVQLSNVANFLRESGFNESSVGTSDKPPKSTAADIASFFEKLYKGNLANTQYTSEMIELLKGQQLNGGLPKFLGNTMTAHKTGEIGWFKHDAGIVYAPKGDYIIVVLSESNSPAGAQERIALLSKAVYEYFNKL